ncbi:MAG: translocation/assembly module TamB domain-containing protein [Gammaproteobacteria bacterium]
MRQLEGELRGYPLRGELEGRWSQQQLSLSTLQLNVAGTTLSAQGQLARSWDLQFHAASDNLGKLLPTAKGRFDLEGRLSGKASAPRLSLQGKAEGLDYEQNQVASLDLQLDMGLAATARSYLELQATGVQTRNTLWQQVQIQTRGTNAAQTISLQASNQDASLRSQLHGRFTPWRWRGSLDEFELNQPHYGKWQLEQPVKLALARGDYSLSSLCLVQGQAHLCLQGQWSATRRQARLDIKTFPLHLLQPWLAKDIQLNGELNAQARLQTTTKGELRGDLVASSPAMSIALRFTELNEQLQLAASSLTAKLDSQGLHAALHLPLAAGGGIDSELRLPGWKPATGWPRTQPVVASLQLKHIPAEVITRLVPQTAQARGQLQADLHVAGSLGEPHLHGSASWQGGSVLVPQLGIHIRKVNASISSIKTNTVAFRIGAHSGDGTVQIDGQTELDPTKGWPTHATLTSHNLEVSNNAQAYVLVDSSLRIYLQDNVIIVDGNINVPRARLHPQSLPEGAVPVSPDLVIVNADKKTTFVTRWLLTARLRVQLGDQVEFKGFGISGKLRGKLALSDEPGKLIMGQGEVSIADGSYRLRGQDLTIRRGRLIFSNTFIDDPAVDVEAVREVNTVTAGVRIKGTLKQPQLTIFSEPTMSQSDALSYLLLGHAMSQSTLAEGQSVSNAASALGLVAGDYLAKGIGGTLGLDELRLDVNQTTQNTSLVLGKYLSPKLYLRYYSGIAESSRILQLQYQLSRRFQIQTESGYRGSQSITGGDIFFTIDY